MNEESINHAKGFVDVLEIEKFEYNYRVSNNNNNNNNNGSDGIFKQKFCKRYWTEMRSMR